MEAEYDPNVIPISALNPYQNRWWIKARVTRKSKIITWNKPNNSGKLFHMDLCDSHGGEIRATLFKAAVDKFFDLIEEGKVYLISRGYLKSANAKFNTTNNSYEMTLDDRSIIQATKDDQSVISHLYLL